MARHLFDVKLGVQSPKPSVTVYADAACTRVANIQTAAGAAIAGGVVAVGLDRRLTFLGPDGATTVYVKPSTDPAVIVALNAPDAGDLTTDVELQTAVGDYGLRGEGIIQLSRMTSPDVAKAANNPNHLNITTYDGGNQLTHPSVLDTGSTVTRGFAGKRFWMAATPYAAANNQVENPCVYVSDDGVTWAPPAGLTNPVEPTPAAGYNSDPDLCLSADGKTMYMFWRSQIGSGTDERIYVRSTTDGVNWTPKVTLFQNTAPFTRQMVAPSVIHDGTQFVMFAVDLVPNPNGIMRATCAGDPTVAANWSTPTAVTIAHPTPATRDIWHIDVNRWVGGQLHMLFDDTTLGGNAGGDLYFAISDDNGLTWTVAAHPMLSGKAASWDVALYRSSMVPALVNGRAGYRLWYTSTNPGYYIGVTDVKLNQSDEAAGLWLPEDNNLLEQTYDPVMGQTATNMGVAGQLQVITLKARDYRTVTNIILCLTNAGVTLTAGQCFAAIYQDGVLLGVTADQATAWASAGVKTMAIVGGPVTVKPGRFQIVCWANGTTVPKLQGGGAFTSVNNGAAGGKARFGTADTGITTTAPAALGAVTAGGISPWAAVS